MSEETNGKQGKAQVDFICPENSCDGIVQFNLNECTTGKIQALCPKCHKPYVFDHELRQKFTKLQNLISAVRDAESILGDCCVSVDVPGGSVKVPYALLLTRLNTMLTLRVGDKTVDFHLWIEPSSPQTFR